jgi:hypothetical protein
MRATSPNGIDLHDERTDLNEPGIHRKPKVGTFHCRIVEHDRRSRSRERSDEGVMRATSPNGTDLHDKRTDLNEPGIHGKLKVGTFHCRIVGHDRRSCFRERSDEGVMRATSPTAQISTTSGQIWMNWVSIESL